MCLKTLEICEIRTEKSLSAPGLAWQAALQKTNIKLDFLTHIDILLMVGIGIRGGICLSIYWYAPANNTWKTMVKIKVCHIFNTGM